MSRRSAYAMALGLIMAMGFAGVATAGQVNPGDLIVTDFGNGTVDDVNPTTGASFVIASGFSNPQGLAINAQGLIFVSDIGTSTIDEVNPTTGVVTTFSGAGVGTGPALNRPFQMAFLGNTLYVAEGGVPNGNTTAIYAIDANGNRTLAVGNNGSSNNLFTGSLAGLAIDSQGNIFASAPTAASIYRVPAAFPPTPFPPLTTAVTAPQGLAIGANGQLLAVSGGPTNPSIWSINPTTGTATDIANNNGIGTGPAFGNLRGITFNNGFLYVTDLGSSANPQIDRVDPTTGNRTVIAGNGVGGTTFGQLSYGIAVYPTIGAVPEPSGLALLAVGAAGIAIAARRRGSRRAA